jgi:hypothetical protein
MAMRKDLEHFKMTFGDIVRTICKYPKMYFMHGTFGEALAFLDGYANGRNFGPGRSSSYFNPFKDWLAKKLELERTGNFWQRFCDSYGDDETALKEFSRYWTEYEAAGHPGGVPPQ